MHIYRSASGGALSVQGIGFGRVFVNGSAVDLDAEAIEGGPTWRACVGRHVGQFDPAPDDDEPRPARVRGHKTENV